MPFYCEEVLPFDTWEIDLGTSIRNLQTQVHPVMDDAYCDFYWFFVPSRLIWKHWEQLMGVAEPSAFSNPVEYELPVFGSHGNSVGKGSIANGLGLPAGLNLGSGDIGDDINMLPLLGLPVYGTIGLEMNPCRKVIRFLRLSTTWLPVIRSRMLRSPLA